MPTPTAHESKGAVTEKTMNRHSLDLTNYVAVYPTPGTGGVRGGNASKKKLAKNQSLTADEIREMGNGKGGKLNPSWVEWLMGFPVGWTIVETERSGRRTKKV